MEQNNDSHTRSEASGYPKAADSVYKELKAEAKKSRLQKLRDRLTGGEKKTRLSEIVSTLVAFQGETSTITGHLDAATSARLQSTIYRANFITAAALLETNTQDTGSKKAAKNAFLLATAPLFGGVLASALSWQDTAPPHFDTAVTLSFDGDEKAKKTQTFAISQQDLAIYKVIPSEDNKYLHYMPINSNDTSMLAGIVNNIQAQGGYGNTQTT